MVKNILFFIRALVFLMILSILIIETNYILTPKKYIDNTWPTTSTYKGFYQMTDNSIDVLFLGSSHAASGFNPQEIYNNYGIRSYNLGCEEQNILVSYYWLKEALKSQKPKVVVLDTYMLFEYDYREPLNTSEPCTRMAIDAMKWSKVKYEAIKAICDNDKQQNFNSYIFKNIRFHNRWMNLTEQDFTYRQIEKHYELKGFVPLNNICDNISLDYQPYLDYDLLDYETPVPLMNEYLTKINDLCAENDIKLMLVKTPSAEWSTSKHNYVRHYANINKLDFIDFNTKEVFDKSDFVYTEDMNDDGHCNIWGSKKVSLYIANKLKEAYGVGSGEHCDQWSNTNDYYQKILADCSLKYITDLNGYIDSINQERYTILMACRNDMTFCVDDDVKKAFSKLGLDLNSNENDSFYAAINDYNTVQQISGELLKYSGSTRNKLQDFTIVSGGYNVGAQSSIKIGDVEYAQNKNGINIVIYNEDTRKVIDSVVFDGTLTR